MEFMEDGTVDFIMTSPPYWNLKDYGHDGQIGQSGYGEYLDELNRVWDECYRVASPTPCLSSTWETGGTTRTTSP